MTVPASRSQPYRRKNDTWRRVKHKTASLLQRMPELWRALSWGRTLQKGSTRRARALLVVLAGRLKGYFGPNFQVDRVLWIDPRLVVSNSRREFSVSDFKGRVMAGDWDQPQLKFDDLDICAAVRAVCQEGKPWSETIFYQRAQARLSRGLSSWRCRDQAAFDRRCLFLENLYHSIITGGYKTQAELAQLKPGGRLTRSDDDEREEIGVNIGRSGDLLFSDGGHRLAIAKVLDLRQIPVKIVVRHAQWAELRKRLIQYAKAHDRKFLPPWPHPDLSDLPYNPDYERLVQIIQADLPKHNASILDIGAQFGYFCHRFEEQGLNCFALEEGQAELPYLGALHRAMHRKFTILDKPLSSIELPGASFDAVLVLNRFLQIERQPEQLAALIKDLRGLHFQNLYVLSAWNEDQGHAGDSPLAVIIAGQLGLEQAHALACLNNGKTLYVLKGGKSFGEGGRGERKRRTETT